VDVLLYHGMHGYLVGCLALARASAALVGSHATAQDAVAAIRNAWRQPGVGPPLMCRQCERLLGFLNGLRAGAMQGDASSVALDGAEGAGTAAGLERSPSGGCMPWSPSGDAATSFVLGASTAAKARRRCVHVKLIEMVFSLGLS
jgi:hypothetical protein